MKSKTNEKKPLQCLALFLICLVLTLPFYSAQALAVNVKIIKNSGEAGLPNYLNANGDLWTVQAQVSDLNLPEGGTLTPEQMQISVEGSTDTFETCSSSSTGTGVGTGGTGFVCEYISDLSSGVSEATYNLQVKHLPSGASDGASLTADGSAPSISFSATDVHQTSDGKLQLDFTVDDLPAAGVGLAGIEIIDADAGAILQSITSFTEGQRHFRYSEVAEFTSILQAPSFFTGEGFKRLKITARDKLGHSATSSAIRFNTDFVKPDILNVSFLDIGEFIGPFSAFSDMVVFVHESSDLGSAAPVAGSSVGVTALSEHLTFASNRANCEFIAPEDKLWLCIWEHVQVSPTTSLNVALTATDARGNTLERTLSKSFTQDASAPSIEFFGSNKKYQENSYITNGDNLIELRITDIGAGMALEGIRANLGSLDGGTDVPPSSCEDIGDIFACNWTISGVSVEGQQRATISLTKFEDKAGNRGELVSREMLVDTSKPDVRDLVVSGISADGRSKDYFQSGDQLNFKMKVFEFDSPFFFTINLDGVVNDAASAYPAGERNQEGWEIFNRDDACTSVQDEETFEFYWDCSFTTRETLRSGYQQQAEIVLTLEDIAGNKEESWPEEKFGRMQLQRQGDEAEFVFKKLAVLDEANPDYWEVRRGGVRPVAGEDAFIDMETTEFASTRMALRVSLQSEEGQARLKEVRLVGCTSEKLVSEELGRQALWNNFYPDPQSSPASFNLVLEFPPFNAREFFATEIATAKSQEVSFEKAYLNHTCTFQLFSQLGNQAVQRAETQQVAVMVAFGFSETGAADENLADLIAKEKEAVSTGFWGFLGTLNDIFKVVRYLASAASLIIDIIRAFNLAEIAFGSATEIPQYVPVEGESVTAGRISYCLGNKLTEVALEKAIEPFQTALQVLSCNQITCGAGALDETTWYGKFVCSIVDAYNFMTFGWIGTAAGSTQGTSIGELYSTGWNKLGQSTLPGGTEGIDATLSDIIGPPAASNYDNLYLSIISLCIPGVIHNLDKFRQIKCQYIDCLENSVPAGTATIHACSEMYDVLVCKYFVGPLWELIPFLASFEQLARLVQSLITDPVAVVTSAVILGCASSCYLKTAGPQLSAGCVQAYFVIRLLSIAETTWGTIDQIAAELEQGGADYCGRIEFPEDEEEETPEEELTGEEAAAAPPPEQAQI